MIIIFRLLRFDGQPGTELVQLLEFSDFISSEAGVCLAQFLVDLMKSLAPVRELDIRNFWVIRFRSFDELRIPYICTIAGITKDFGCQLLGSDCLTLRNFLLVSR